MYILGLHTSHDSSACLLKDGEILLAIEMERITRHKHQRGNQNYESLIDYCLSAANISLADIAFIVTNDIDNVFLDKIISPNEFHISHHLAHAWAAVGLSNFDNCAVLVLDGEGSKVIELSTAERKVCSENIDFYAEKESCYLFKENRLIPIKKWTSGRGGESKFSGTDATGSPYWFLSQHLFNKKHQESKIMGLSSYGQPSDKFTYIFNYESEGSVKIDTQWIFDFKRLEKNNWKENFDLYAQIAASIQYGTEHAIIHKAEWLKKVTQQENLCFSGGVALNCVANARLASHNIFKEVFVPFAAGDSSIAIGCAFYGWYCLAQQNRVKVQATPYLGKTYDEQEVLGSITKMSELGLIKYSVPENHYHLAAQYLHNGEIIGWFQGKSEFGPRALGNRSILANPSKKDVRQMLNEKVKYRESYRPFGPCVLEDDAVNWFDDIVPGSYFMQFIAKAKEVTKDLASAVVHIDGTARLQLVNKESNADLYLLLQNFKRLSGLPILINTSFNIQEPIVESPFDALLTFISSSMETLFLNNYCIKSTVQKVETIDELQGKTCFAVVHKNVRLSCYPNNRWTLQIINGLQNNFKFGNYFQISDFAEQNISKELYNFLAEAGFVQGEVKAVTKRQSEQLSSIFSEFQAQLIHSRVITIIAHN